MDGGTDGLKPSNDGYVSCHAVSCHSLRYPICEFVLT